MNTPTAGPPAASKGDMKYLAAKYLAAKYLASKFLAALLIAMLALAGAAGPLRAQRAVQPIGLSDLPHIAIFSPVFYWTDTGDVVGTASATCPEGRAIAGGVSIQKGNASLRIQESYPDRASWVVRVVNRGNPGSGRPLQVRGFAVCLLPVARSSSVPIAQYPRLLHLSNAIKLPPKDVRTAGRQACAKNMLVVSGGFGLDPKFNKPSFVRMELSYPDQWAWNVRAVNAAGAAQPGADARVHTLCLGTSEGLSIRDYRTIYFVDANVSVKAGDGVVRRSVGCREASARALAGGARLIRGKGASIEMQESFPDSPGSWTIALTNRAPANAGNATVKLYAVCIKP